MERGRAPHRKFSSEELSNDFNRAFPLKKDDSDMPTPSSEVVECDDTDILPESHVRQLRKIFEEGPDLYSLDKLPEED